MFSVSGLRFRYSLLILKSMISLGLAAFSMSSFVSWQPTTLVVEGLAANLFIDTCQSLKP